MEGNSSCPNKFNAWEQDTTLDHFSSNFLILCDIPSESASCLIFTSLRIRGKNPSWLQKLRNLSFLEVSVNKKNSLINTLVRYTPIDNNSSNCETKMNFLSS